MIADVKFASGTSPIFKMERSHLLNPRHSCPRFAKVLYSKIITAPKPKVVQLGRATSKVPKQKDSLHHNTFAIVAMTQTLPLTAPSRVSKRTAVKP